MFLCSGRKKDRNGNISAFRDAHKAALNGRQLRRVIEAQCEYLEIDGMKIERVLSDE